MGPPWCVCSRGVEMARRVLWLSKGLGRGGAEQLLVEHAFAARHAPDLTFEAAYLLPWKDQLVGELEKLGIPCHCLEVSSEADLRWLGRLRRLVIETRADIVHAHSPLSASLARVWLRSLRPRPSFVYTEHNVASAYEPATRALNWSTYALNDAVIAVSDEVRMSVPSRFRSNVETIVHGIDVGAVREAASARDAVRAEFGVTDGQLLGVTVANLREGKGYPILLEAAQRVVGPRSPWRFIAAGQGPLEQELRERCERLGVAEQFRFLGYRSDARRLLAGADVFVLASLQEGLPVAVMEAMALGVPVVATRVGGLPEAVEDGVNGLLVPAADRNALADALRRVEDPALRERLAAGARDRGEQFSAEAATERINQIYRALPTRRR
jgi:glycosyltransferase involved in cell wall biosynthesis